MNNLSSITLVCVSDGAQATLSVLDSLITMPLAYHYEA